MFHFPRRIFLNIWRHLPHKLRQEAAYTFFDWLNPRLSPTQGKAGADNSIPIIVVGFLSSPSGLGQAARLCAKAFTATGYRVYGIDLSRYFYELSNTVSHNIPDGKRVFGSAHTIININAPYLPYVLFLLGRSFLKEKYVTGYWAWELPQIPSSWHRGFSGIHDIAVPSRFVADAISASNATRVVSVAPHPVVLDAPPESPLCERLPSSSRTFIVVNTTNIASGFERKKPLALISAFRMAFGNATDCRLKMLVTNAHHHSPARAAIEKAIEGSNNIEIAWSPMNRDALWAWWGTPNIYASLHRSEGFGLPLAEAMCAGYPVVATGWSGNMEFMTQENSFPVGFKLVDVDDPQHKYDSNLGKWADPDIEDAARLLQRVKSDPGAALQTGRVARQDCLNTLFVEFRT